MDRGPGLLDFLYADHERVASFLAQLYGIGAPKQAEQSARRAKKVNEKASLNFGGLAGGGGREADIGKEVRNTYDPLWSNSQRLIEEVQERSDASAKAQLGQIRILSGKLLAYDLSALTSIMNAEAMEDFIAAGVQDDDALANRSSTARKAEKKKQASIMREFIRSLPLGVAFVLVTEEGHYWFSVKREYLSLYDLDVPLKFPVHISGRWSVLGVIDAIPNDHVEGVEDVFGRGVDGLLPAMVFHMMQLTGATAAMFGRPITAFGLSPLVVFRNVLSAT